MFKIEYISSYNICFRVGILFYMGIPLKLSPALTFRSLKNERSDVIFSDAHLCI